jgi:adenylate cyclase
MHELMNRYYREIVAEVERQGGVVANIVGDGLLALWPVSDAQPVNGASINNEDKPAERACRAAIAIVEVSDRMSTTLGEPMQTCVGIHCGAVSLGNLGAGQHLEYAPVGDTINTTSRVEAYNRQLSTRILLTEPVRRWLEQYLPIPFALRSHGNAVLKGKREPLGLYELVADVAI